MRRVLDYVRGRKGKMMRPILVLLLAKELGTIAEPTLHAAVSLELLHTSSLIHDDVVDESEERRGKASVRKVYDNKVAVLLGDYMLAKTLSQSAMTGHIGIVDAVARLGATLAEGEILQLSHVEQESFSETTYFKIIHRKTGALFEACGEPSVDLCAENRCRPRSTGLRTAGEGDGIHAGRPGFPYRLCQKPRGNCPRRGGDGRLSPPSFGITGRLFQSRSARSTANLR